jgi:hypothetical protein
MSEREKIEERLRKKEQEISGLEEKVRAARIYVQALRDILKMLDAEDNEGDPTLQLREGSMVAQAREVILSKGEPVHIDDLLDTLGKDVTRDTRASLTGSLSAYVRKNQIFTRPAPSTFGLIELAGNSVDAESAEPPSNFGTVTAPPPPSVLKS